MTILSTREINIVEPLVLNLTLHPPHPVGCHQQFIKVYLHTYPCKSSTHRRLSGVVNLNSLSYCIPRLPKPLFRVVFHREPRKPNPHWQRRDLRQVSPEIGPPALDMKIMIAYHPRPFAQRALVFLSIQE